MNSHNNSRKTSTPVFKSTRLLDQLREQIRYLHYSLRTEEAYVSGEKVHLFSSKAAAARHGAGAGAGARGAFLTHRAVERKVSV
jgi:hypothetical protein